MAAAADRPLSCGFSCNPPNSRSSSGDSVQAQHGINVVLHGEKASKCSISSASCLPPPHVPRASTIVPSQRCLPHQPHRRFVFSLNNTKVFECQMRHHLAGPHIRRGSHTGWQTLAARGTYSVAKPYVIGSGEACKGPGQNIQVQLKYSTCSVPAPSPSGFRLPLRCSACTFGPPHAPSVLRLGLRGSAAPTPLLPS